MAVNPVGAGGEFLGFAFPTGIIPGFSSPPQSGLPLPGKKPREWGMSCPDSMAGNDSKGIPGSSQLFPPWPSNAPLFLAGSIPVSKGLGFPVPSFPEFPASAAGVVAGWDPKGLASAGLGLGSRGFPALLLNPTGAGTPSCSFPAVKEQPVRKRRDNGNGFHLGYWEVLPDEGARTQRRTCSQWKGALLEADELGAPFQPIPFHDSRHSGLIPTTPPPPIPTCPTLPPGMWARMVSASLAGPSGALHAFYPGSRKRWEKERETRSGGGWLAKGWPRGGVSALPAAGSTWIHHVLLGFNHVIP